MPEDYRWWEEHDPRYVQMLPKWEYTWDVYTADPQKLRTEKYLKQKTQGEHKDNFKERRELANFIPLLATIVKSYVGRAAESEKKIIRRFNREEEDGLGDARDPSTTAGKIWHNSDGRGTNYLPMLNEVATILVTKSVVWGFIDGISRDGDGREVGGPHIRVIHPDAVPITVEDESGNVIAAVVHHERNTRASVFDKNEIRDRYTAYTLDGSMEYEIQTKEEKDGKSKQVAVRVDGGTGEEPIPYGDDFAFYEGEERDTKILPIFRVELTGDEHPAYGLAHQNISYFNTYSELQNKHRTCNILKLQVPYMDTDDKQEKGGGLAEGSTVIWISPESNRDVQWVEPNAASLKETREWLKENKIDFLFSALQQYEDSARGGQKTATEIAQDAAHGEHSFLNVLVSALDEFEMQGWRRIEQIQWPRDADKWGQFYVERKRDFRPLDEEGEAMQLKSMFFPTSTVPIGTKGRINVAKRIAELQDAEYDEDELAEDVMVLDDAEAQARQVPSASTFLRMSRNRALNES